MKAKLFALSLLALGLALFAVPVQAAAPPVGYHLDLQLRSPVWSSRSGYVSSWQSTEFGGKLLLDNVIPQLPRFHPFVAGMQAMGNLNSIFDAKSEMQIGFDWTLGHGFTFTSYWDRHYVHDVDRAFVGLKYNTSGIF